MRQHFHLQFVHRCHVDIRNFMDGIFPTSAQPRLNRFRGYSRHERYHKLNKNTLLKEQLRKISYVEKKRKRKV